MRNITFILLFVSGILTAQTNYFVSNEGSDNNNGLTPQSAWKTVSKVNKTEFAPGDTIFFEANGIWREELQISNSGTKDKPIVYTSYGTGDRPKFYASEACVNFTKTAIPNIWRSDTEVTDPSYTGYPGSVYFEYPDTTIWGREQKDYDASFSELKEEFDWCWYNKNIYVYAPTDPDSRYSSVETGQRDHSIVLMKPNPNYITIDGFQTSYGKRRIIYCAYPASEARGLTIRNCEVSFAGIKGGESAYGIFTFYSDVLIENNFIHDCGRRGISYTVYAQRGVYMSNVVVQNNVFYNGYHTTAIDCQILLGDGDTKGDTLRNFHFRNNFIYNDPNETLLEPEGETSNDIFFQTDDTTGGNTAHVSGIYIYNNIVVNTKSRAILINHCDSVYVWNNTIYGINQTNREDLGIARSWALVSFGSTKVIDFRNNIIYGNAMYDTHGPSACLFAEENVSNTFRPKFSHFDNNLFFQVDSSRQRLIYHRGGINGGCCVRMHDGSDMGWDEYVANNPDQNQNSPIPADPQFINPEIFDFRISENSPAKGRGVVIPLVKTDFFGNQMNTPPDLGAIQFGAEPPEPPVKDIDGDFIVYPNPVLNSTAYISINEKLIFETFKYKIYSLNGTIVYQSGEFMNYKEEITLNRRLSGIYLFEITIDKRDPIIKKLIIL